MAVSHSTEHAAAMQPSDCTLGRVSQRNKDFRSHKNLVTNAHGGFISNSPKRETTQRSLGGIVRQAIVHGTPLSNEKVWTADEHKLSLEGSAESR